MRFDPNRPIKQHYLLPHRREWKESIMKNISNEMKQREQSGCLDFGPIRVQLTATGKELDDSIAFIDNLKAQLESAKQDQ
ncbi:hypothetical protein B9Z55_026015 [Caenorhabditis nigoni]|uniref:Uncharacterized protein n=1 Tax=Caenorhabditis nigoni TaxID=1611254 RepID=A0A2G5T1K7_9PELO|nr:hypothetical protein B9Z55_026015 [Caenorhabditis nigoni]